MSKNKNSEFKYILEKYKREKGVSEINMSDLARFALDNGWNPPEPITPTERLAKHFSRMAREETKQDKETGESYRVYHAVYDSTGQGVFWIDIDEAPRGHMHKSVYSRREQVVGDLYQLTLDVDHWNRINPNEEPLRVETDITPDIEEKRAISTLNR